MPKSGPLTADVLVCVEGFYPVGGLERQATNILLGLQARDVRVGLLSRWPLATDNAYIQELDSAGVPVLSRGWIGLGTSRLDRTAVHLARALSFNRNSGLVRAAWAWEAHTVRTKVRGNPVLHELPILGRIPWQGRRVLEGLEKPVVHTTFGSPEVAPLPATPWAVLTSDGAHCHDPGFRFIPSVGVAHPFNEVALRPSFERRILVASRIEPGKGIDILLSAAALLGSGVQVRVAGEGSELSRLRAVAARYEVDVRFLGLLRGEELATEFARAALVAVPSTSGEGVPSVLAEALAAGRPVVATKTGGIPYLAQAAGKASSLVLVPPSDVEAMAHSLRSLLSMGGDEVSRSARKLYEALLSPSAVLPQYMAAYEEAKARVTARSSAS